MIRKEQIIRLKRYFICYLRHATLCKILNLIKVEYKLARRKSSLKDTYPYSMVVEISNTCNLRCPLCQMGQRRIIPRENLMTFENYKILISPLKDYLFQVFLYNWGEPFFNKDIYEIIRHNTSNNISTVLSSNFNVHIDAEKLIESGLEHLVISGDGITQEIYEKYRVGGKIDLVLDNLRNIVRIKKEAKSKLPHIEWQCLVTMWNEKELKDIKRIALGAGADEVRFYNINFYSAENREAAEKQWLPQNPAYRKFASRPMLGRERFRRHCFWLWRLSVVSVNGGMNPCCLYDVPDWGNILDTPFLSVWNNEKYREARMRFSKNNKKRKINLICDICDR